MRLNQKSYTDPPPTYLCVDDSTAVLQPDSVVDYLYNNIFDAEENCLSPDDLWKSGMGELVSFYQDPAELSESLPVAQWGSMREPQSKTGLIRHDSMDCWHESMVSSPENLSEIQSSPSRSLHSFHGDVAQVSYLDDRQYRTISNSPAAKVDVSSKTQAVTENAQTARSARARHAANHRHSRRKDSSWHNTGSTDSTEGSGRREELRVKNRTAAAKCRRRKRADEAILEASYRTALAGNNALKRELRELRDLLTVCRTLALEHMHGNNDCNCEGLQQYNKNQAHMTALNVQSQSRYAYGPQLYQRHIPEHSRPWEARDTGEIVAG